MRLALARDNGRAELGLPDSQFIESLQLPLRRTDLRALVVRERQSPAFGVDPALAQGQFEWCLTGCERVPHPCQARRALGAHPAGLAQVEDVREQSRW